MRGLKHSAATADNVEGVASFTDAWIETYSLHLLIGLYQVASFTDAWIETFKMIHQYHPKESRIFYRCVD